MRTPHHPETAAAHPGVPPRRPAPPPALRSQALTGAAVLALQRAGGNRATAALLEGRRTPPEARPQAGVQRMVVYTDRIDRIDDVIGADFVLQQTMARARVDEAGRAITLDQLDDAANPIAIEPDEAVVVVGHGEPGAIQGKTAADLAGKLLRIRNIEKAAFIYFASCDAATDKAGEPRSSVVDVTAEVLPHLRVAGAPGLAVTDYARLTGDFKTTYRKETQFDASVLETLVIHVSGLHEIKNHRGHDSVTTAVQHGKQLIENPQFRRFYDLLVRALSGSDRAAQGQLLTFCEQGLAAVNADPGAWPAWVRSWYQAEASPAAAGTDRDAVWRIKAQLEGVQELLGQKMPSLVSRADRGDPPLRTGSGEKLGYGRLAADAEWYRDQREVMRGHGLLTEPGAPEEMSLRPATDRSSEYLS